MISVRRDYVHDLPAVTGDARRLEVAFLNLLNNAGEAMPGGGNLTVRVASHAPGTIDISFTDTGIGIDKADLQNVLKPFFSSKPTGTGLGLPLVARIVAAHQGQLLIESEKGDGTTVRVRLPVASAKPSDREETKWVQHESSSSTTTTSSVP
jgi:signal transduction histidine kinase